MSGSDFSAVSVSHVIVSLATRLSFEHLDVLVACLSSFSWINLVSRSGNLEFIITKCVCHESISQLKSLLCIVHLSDPYAAYLLAAPVAHKLPEAYGLSHFTASNFFLAGTLAYGVLSAMRRIQSLICNNRGPMSCALCVMLANVIMMLSPAI